MSPWIQLVQLVWWLFISHVKASGQVRAQLPLLAELMQFSVPKQAFRFPWEAINQSYGSVNLLVKARTVICEVRVSGLFTSSLSPKVWRTKTGYYRRRRSRLPNDWAG